MLKSNCRKAVGVLLRGAGCLVGRIIPLSSQKPAFPKSCEWLVFPYSWCVIPELMDVVSVEQEEPVAGGSSPPEEQEIRGVSPDVSW